ncbi:rhodanese-like domain-containing protein [Fulvivirga imtechensis]|nr:rhodanese-like domain-containing protein [Fulvivirga imtechensis]
MSQQDFDTKLKSILDGSVPFIYVDDLRKKLETDQNLVILDTRQPEEYHVSHLKGAIFIDYDHFSKDMVAGMDKDAPVVVYCSVGYRSEKIGEKLRELGFKNVSNLYGGIFDWKNKGNDVVNEHGVTDSVHTYNASWSRWLKKGVKVYE